MHAPTFGLFLLPVFAILAFLWLLGAAAKDNPKFGLAAAVLLILIVVVAVIRS